MSIAEVSVGAAATALGKDVMNFSNSTSPIGIISDVSIRLVDVCMLPNIKYPVKCAIFLANCTYAVFSPEPFSKISCFAMARSLLL